MITITAPHPGLDQLHPALTDQRIFLARQIEATQYNG